MSDSKRHHELRVASSALRLRVLGAHRAAGAGHLGSSLSIVELLTVLFREHFQWCDEDPWRGDRFVLSKGHAALAYYALLVEIGRLDAAALSEFGRSGSRLEPHPNETLLEDVHATTGSLGQGLSIALGLALGSRLRGEACNTFVVVGDGECNEGQIWEAALSAVHLHLDNLVVLLDDNGMQQDGPTDEILPVREIDQRWAQLGWHTVSCDGHDVAQLDDGLARMLTVRDGRPKLIHGRTIKAKGVDYLEGRTESHYPPPLSASDLALLRYTLTHEAEQGRSA